MFVAFDRDYLQEIHDLLDELRDLDIKVPVEVHEHLENIEHLLIDTKEELQTLKDSKGVEYRFGTLLRHLFKRK